MINKHRVRDEYGARVRKSHGMDAVTVVKGRWEITCRDKRGNIKWTDHIDNLVTNAGLNYLLDAGLSGGTQVTSWYVGLTDGTPTANAADTMALA